MRSERLYTTHEIADLLQVDPSTVSKWIDKGLLPAFRTPGRHRRVQRAHLTDFLRAHRMPVPEELGGSGELPRACQHATLRPVDVDAAGRFSTARCVQCHTTFAVKPIKARK